MYIDKIIVAYNGAKKPIYRLVYDLTMNLDIMNLDKMYQNIIHNESRHYL